MLGFGFGLDSGLGFGSGLGFTDGNNASSGRNRERNHCPFLILCPFEVALQVPTKLTNLIAHIVIGPSEGVQEGMLDQA